MLFIVEATDASTDVHLEMLPRQSSRRPLRLGVSVESIGSRKYD
jgi:hypothetical protein